MQRLLMSCLRTAPTKAGSLLVIALLLTALTAPSAEARTWFRVGYSPLFNGNVAVSPLDPDGKQSDQKVRAPKGELEMIVWDHLGVQATRQEVARGFSSGGNDFQEKIVQLSVNLALYAYAARHDQANWFAGVGSGVVESYKFEINGVSQTDREKHFDIPLQRTFLGWEYTWDRIGMKIEFSQVQAMHTAQQEDIEIRQRFANLAFFIPLN